MPIPGSKRIDLAIITGSQAELEPVLNLLGSRERWDPFELHQFRHYSGQFTSGARSLTVVAAALWNTDGTAAASEIIRLQELYPRLVVMTGTCVGWQEQGIQLGDLCVANRAFEGEQGKLTEAGLQPDIQTYQPPAWLIQWLKDFSYERGWATTITTPRPLSLPYQDDWLLCQRFRDQAFPSTQADWDEVKAKGLDYPRVKQRLQADKLITKAGKLTAKAHQRLSAIRDQNFGELEPTRESNEPHVHYTAFASVAADIAVDTPFVNLSKHVRSLGAIDTAVAAFFAAAFEARTDAFAVKGLARYATPDSDNRFQAYAAEGAARWMHAFVCHVAPQLAAPDTRAAQGRVFLVDQPQSRYYIERTESIAAVRSLLLSGPSSATLSADDGRLVALHGMPGVGKTVLARALCDDPAVQQAFPDGVLWMTLGQIPNRLPVLRRWVETLGGVITENNPTLESLTAQLSQLLQDKACLLIADDVWTKRDLEGLLTSAPRCRVLVTTRNAGLMRDLGAQVYHIPVMNRREATALLEKWAAGHLASVEQGVKDRIIKELGYLPLALKLAGVQLQSTVAEEWLRSFDVRTLNALEREEIHDSLLATFSLSLDALDSYDTRIARPYRTRQLYAALGIFKEDERIPEAAIAQLWQGLHGLDRNATRNLIDDLAARALLDMTLEVTSAGPSRLVTLHDLLRDTLSVELGDGWIATHQALLDAYRPPDGLGWHTAPDDGYLYNHLAYHLDAIGAADELKELFANQGWMHARVEQSGYIYDGYLAELDLAWNQADAKTRRQIETGQEPAAFADCVRNALIRANMNSIRANYVPTLIAQAVKTGLWSMEQALRVTDHVWSAEDRAEMYSALLRTTDHDSLCLMKVDREIQASKLPERSQLVEETLAAAREITKPRVRTQALITLAESLSAPERSQVLQEALAAALDIKLDAGTETMVMGRMATEGLFRLLRTQALTKLIPLLSEAERPSVLQHAIETARTIHYSEDLAEALTKLIPLLSEAERSTALQHTISVLQHDIETAANRRHHPGYSEALTALVPLLRMNDRPHIEQALGAACAIDDEVHRAQVLVALVPKLSEAQLPQALKAALAIRLQVPRRQVLSALLPKLGEAQLPQALTALAIGDADLLARVLAVLLPQPSDILLKRILEATTASVDVVERAQVLVALVQELREAELPQTLEAALEEEFLLSRARARPELSVFALMEWQPDLNTLAIDDVNLFANVFALLASQPSELLPQRILEAAIANANDDVYGRAQVLTALAPMVSATDRPHVVQQAFDAVRAIDDEVHRAQALVALMPQLSEINMSPQALEAAQDITKPTVRAQLLSTLAPMVSATERPHVVQQAFDAAHAIDGISITEAQALAALVPYVSEAQLPSALKAALTITYQRARVPILNALAPRLSKAQLPWALVARTTDDQAADESALGRALSNLSRHGSEALARHALQHLRKAETLLRGQSSHHTLEDVHLSRQQGDKLSQQQNEWKKGWERFNALTALASELSATERSPVVQEALKVALALHSVEARGRALGQLASYLNEAQLREALRESLHNLEYIERNEVLRLCANKTLFTPPILSAAILDTVAAHIIEICQEWRWL